VAEYNLERLGVLLVEDNAYVRNILSDTLRQFRFGNVETASNGEAAIEYFKMHPKDAGRARVDFIFSDLVMSPVNGLLLLRWLRTAEESPDRFMPFLMVSGAADREYVEAARNLGVSEFMAKPFSALSVSKYILECIDHPRQFVATQKYFGPDRRRRKLNPPGEERRISDEKNATIVYSADKIVKPTKLTDVWYFRLPNRLREVAGGLGAKGPGSLPAEILAEAEEQLERSALDFADWAQDYLKELSGLCEKSLSNPEGRKGHFREINLLAHELRGQGGTFGYPLITIFAKMLYDCTWDGCPTDDDDVEIVKAHIDAMRAVLRDKVAGDGGETGRALIKGLEATIERKNTIT